MADRIELADLVIELDKRTGNLDCFIHAGGRQARSPELKRNLIAVLISHCTNLGLTRMADACGISYDVLAPDHHDTRSPADGGAHPRPPRPAS